MEYAEVLNLIKNRRSLYPMQMEEGSKIPNESIHKILELANYAPSHKRTEPWRFIVMEKNGLSNFLDFQIKFIQDSKIPAKKKAEKILKTKRKKDQVSHIIAVCMHRDEEKRIPRQEEEYAVACSVQNMLLGLDSLGLIGYWSTGNLAFSNKTKHFFKLNQEDHCMGFLILGLPKAKLNLKEKIQISEIEKKVTWRS